MQMLMEERESLNSKQKFAKLIELLLKIILFQNILTNKCKQTDKFQNNYDDKQNNSTQLTWQSENKFIIVVRKQIRNSNKKINFLICQKLNQIQIQIFYVKYNFFILELSEQNHLSYEFLEQLKIRFILIILSAV
ncbi:hypothetical protein ABPG74_021969 [Tetrahymena malaccensis]